MLNYHNICLQDGEKIRSYSYNSEMRSCAYSISNLYSRNNVYKTQLAEYKGFIILRYWYKGNLLYFMPLGSGDINEVLRDLAEEAASQEYNLRIMGPMEMLRRDYSELCSVTFNFRSNRNSSEYIYLRSALVSLSGEKLRPKRNHINKFKSLYPDYHFEKLCQDNINDCYTVTDRWIEKHGAENKSVRDERRVILRALENIEALEIKGGVLYVGEVPVAFSFGCAINYDTFGVQVEKADIEYQGAYSMINHEFVKSLPEAYTYINKEEDFGREDLRRYNLSYCPEKLLEMGYALHKQIITPSKRIKMRLKKGWMSVFNLSEQSVNLYLKLWYSLKNTVYMMPDDKLLSSIQTSNFKINFAGDTLPIAYLSYFFTPKEYRGHGYMSEVLKQAMTALSNREFPLAFLFTYEKELVQTYRRRGFELVIKYAEKELPLLDIMPPSCELSLYTVQSLSEYDQTVFEYIDAYLNSSDFTLRVPPCYFNYLIEDMALEGDNCIVVRKGAEISGLSIVYIVKGNVYIHLLACESAEVEELIYGVIKEKYSPKRILRYERVDASTREEDGWRRKNMGMARILNMDIFLGAYAKAFPLESFVYRFKDNVLTANNAVFRVCNGAYNRLEDYNLDVEEISINDLTIKLLGQLNMYAPLMMEAVLPDV